MPRTTKTAVATQDNDNDDKLKSGADWGDQKKEGLVLKCNDCGLDAKGTKLQLQRRLFTYFHSASSVDVELPSSASSGKTNDDIRVSDKID